MPIKDALELLAALRVSIVIPVMIPQVRRYHIVRKAAAESRAHFHRNLTGCKSGTLLNSIQSG